MRSKKRYLGDDIERFTDDDEDNTKDDFENNTPFLKGRIEKTEIKKSPAEVLYGNTHKNEKQEKEYRNSLLDILGNIATPAMVLYSTNKQLENEINKNGLQNKIKGTITGEASGTDNQETKQKVKLLPKIELDDNQTLLKGSVSYDEIKTDDNINNGYFSSDSIKKAREFIQGEEDFRAEAYKDTGGVWTIGYGHIKNVKKGDKITRQEAEKLYAEDFKEHIKPLNEVKIPLSDNEKIALASFIYNVGPNAFKTSTLFKKLNAGDKKGAAQEFKRWVYDNGKVQKGLVNRRNREMNLFLKGNN